MRTVYVGADRFARWSAGFGQRHPGGVALQYADRVELTADDGSTAVLYPAFGPLPNPPQPLPTALVVPRSPGALPGTPIVGRPLTPAEAVELLLADARAVPVLRVLLVRRGGYACAVLSGDRVTASKVGSRHVQGRTAAGGWSQQRFARRRDGQVQVLVGSAIEVAVRVLLPAAPDDGLVTGGDRALLDQVLGEPRLQPLTRLRRGPHLEIGDPRADLLQELPSRARAIRIALHEQG